MMKVRTQLQNEKCKLKIENWRRDSDRQFAICNLHIRRRGLSLTEVLISMGILTLGLLSVASVFPVGSFYMQKAETLRQGVGDRPIGDERHHGARDAESAIVVCHGAESNVDHS